jgi:hypothetical protein
MTYLKKPERRMFARTIHRARLPYPPTWLQEHNMAPR